MKNLYIMGGTMGVGWCIQPHGLWDCTGFPWHPPDARRHTQTPNRNFPLCYHYALRS